jgi:peptidoglycan L-alanyl-D-glutamate endopeptidase CwlK
MAAFSKKSLEILETCDDRIIKILKDTIKYFDFSILYGYRTSDEQFELFRKGRAIKNGNWIITDQSKIVTYLDGTKYKSKHNFEPAQAVDIVPYPVDWQDIERFLSLAEMVKLSALKYDIALTWGGDWRMKDYPHFEI